MGWRIVEIEKNCFVKYFLNNLIITGTQKITIPINDIDVLLFSNCRINVSINLLNALAKENVCVFFCDENYIPTSMIFPIIGNIATLKILDKQINWSKEFKGKLWQKIVYMKCSNQINYLQYLSLLEDEEIKDMNSYLANIKEFDTTNREGHIAKEYWYKLFGDKFARQDDDNIINKVLNYGYTVLNGMVARSIIKKGLDCRISIFHKSVYNQFALSSDFIEPFRNVIDILVIELLKNNVITNETLFLTKYIKEVILDFIANFKLLINGLFQQLNNAIDEFIDSVLNDNIFNLEIKYDYEVKKEIESD